MGLQRQRSCLVKYPMAKVSKFTYWGSKKRTRQKDGVLNVEELCEGS